jgi:enoyl-CoA hydratase/carnithine racemase
MSIVSCETEDRVAIITINRPEVRNATLQPARRISVNR